MSRIVYDAAVLISADLNDRRAWADHKVRLEIGIIPLVPAPVLAQVSRSPRQLQLRRLLKGCFVVPLDERDAHECGRLLEATKTVDVVDAAVVTVAVQRDAVILTGDCEDTKRLARATGRDVAVVAV